MFLDAEPPRDGPERAPVSRATLREMQRARSAFAPGVEWPSLAEPPGVIAGGYGYGLMIWHERDGQRHVGHPGGLPGYGTLMRWVPELGLSAILLANVTYAKCELPAAARARAGRARGRAAAARRPRPPGPAGRARRGRRPRRALGRRRGGAAVLAQRRPRPARWPSGAPSWRRCASATGALARDGELEPEDALRGHWRLRGERGHVDLGDHAGADRAAARADARLSTRCCRPRACSRRSPPRPSTSRASRAARRSARCSHPALDAEEALRGLQVAAALYGPFGDRRAGRGRRRDDDDAAPAERARRRRARARARRRERASRAHRAAPRELGGSVRAIFASSLRGSDESRTVTPLELFFDLVFVFAVSQLTHLLVAHFDTRGAIETLILTLAVVYAWYMTAWVTNWMSPGHLPVQALLLTIMLLSLLMSSGIDGAFTDHGWLFVDPVRGHPGRARGVRHGDVRARLESAHPLRQRPAVGARASPSCGSPARSPTATRGSCCGRSRCSPCMPAWPCSTRSRAGRAATSRAPIGPDARGVHSDVAGEHVLERLRLLFLIALGETLITTGATFASADVTIGPIAALVNAFLASVALWYLYFQRAEGVGLRANEASEDASGIASVGTHAITLVFIALIAIAVGDEFAIAHPGGDPSAGYIALVFGGPALFLLEPDLVHVARRRDRPEGSHPRACRRSRCSQSPPIRRRCCWRRSRPRPCSSPWRRRTCARAAPSRCPASARRARRGPPGAHAVGEPAGRAGRAADQAERRRQRDHPQAGRERAGDVAQGAERQRGERADAVADPEHHPDDPATCSGRSAASSGSVIISGKIAPLPQPVTNAQSTACAGSSAIPIAPTA